MPGQTDVQPPMRERLELIDALRAIALFGVILINMMGIVFVIAAAQVGKSAGPVDYGVMIFESIFIFGKARAAFAFLFGVGFGIILQRTQSSGQRFGTIFARRMGILLCFGLINQIFLFFGDILVNYALLGLVLMLFARCSDRTLLRTGFALIILPPLSIGLAQIVLGGPLPNLAGIPATEISAATAARGMAAHESGSYLEIAKFIATFPYYNGIANPAHRIEYNLSILGLFMLGSLVARHRILFDVEQHRPMLLQVAKWFLPIGFVLSTIHATSLWGMSFDGPLRGLVTAAFAGPPILALGYVAALTLIFSRRANRFQSMIAPAGRMALTNYLASGAIGSFYFYGYGLGQLGKLGIAGMSMFATLLFGALLLLSHLWLSVFRMGPMEWLWRYLIEGKSQPMLRSHRTAGPASAG